MFTIATLVGLGCSSDDDGGDPTGPTNNPPTLTIDNDQLAFGRNTNNTLNATADDPDGDAVTVTWQVTAGTLSNPAPDGAFITWLAPGPIGVQTVTAKADDGNGGITTVQQSFDIGTPRAGSVAGSGTWTADNSPYILSGAPGNNIFAIGASMTLNVDPGVEILVDPAQMQLQVDGTLRLNGINGSPVVVKPNRVTPVAGFWEGIVALAASTLDFNYAQVSHGKNNVLTATGGPVDVSIDHCSIIVAQEVGVRYQSRGNLSITNSRITDNILGGIRVELFAGVPQSITLQGDSIAVNGRFKDSTMYGNLEAGIALIFNDPFRDTPVLITGCEISRNDFPGIRLGNPNLNVSLYPTITGNGIFGNELRKTTRIEIQLEGDFNGNLADPYVNATNNFWGQAFTDSMVIRAKVIDKFDNGNIDAPVWVSPWVDTNPYVPPTN